MPGDHLLPRAQYRCTRAITIRARPEDVWPWLVQVGVQRAGLVRRRPSGQLRSSQRPPDRPRAAGPPRRSAGCRWSTTLRERTAFVVDSFRTAVMAAMALARICIFSWRLPVPPGDQRIRLIARLQTCL